MPARQRGTPDMAGVGRRLDTAFTFHPVADDRAYAAMIARAQALIPQLRERASRTETLRRLPPETERDLHDAGLFRIVQPKRAGGAPPDHCGASRRRPNATCTTPACSGSCSQSASAAPNSTMSR